MHSLTIRRLAFDFSGDVPFQWQPENPRLAITLNAASFFAVGFERYVVRTMRDVLPLIRDQDILQEARSFMAQEAQHGLAHKLHVDSMIRVYPALKQTHEKVCALFDELYENKSMEFRLAYVANAEASFPPVVDFVISNRDALFSQGDRKISSMFLWHAIEEVEHRGSATVVFDRLVNNRWYRFTRLPEVFFHLRNFNKLISKEFTAIIAGSDGKAALDSAPPPFACVPFTQRIRLALNLFRNFMPWHDPESVKPPEWFDIWLQADRDGVDMTTFYGR